jgi:hypothetical protein
MVMPGYENPVGALEPEAIEAAVGRRLAKIHLIAAGDRVLDQGQICEGAVAAGDIERIAA